jgi:hypothetical protein
MLEKKKNPERRSRKRKTSIALSEEAVVEIEQSPESTAGEKTEKINLKLYFNAGTQEAIVNYQNSSVKKDKDKLYVQEILPAFKKLVENLINIHKFTGMHDTYDDLKNDCINFLFETIHKFDASRGTNAFSYFNVVAKNWLIIRTKQKAQRTKKNVSLDDPATLTSHESLIIEEHNIVMPEPTLFETQFFTQNTVNLLYDIRSKVKTENELTCINAIITIFENIDDIDLLNKSAVLLYMRELSGLSPKQLTTAMQSIKRRYKKSKSDYKDN